MAYSSQPPVRRAALEGLGISRPPPTPALPPCPLPPGLGYMVVYYSCDMYEVDGKIYMPHTGGICGAGFTAELLRFLALEFLVLGSAILLHEFGVPDFFAAIMVVSAWVEAAGQGQGWRRLSACTSHAAACQIVVPEGTCFPD